MITPKEAEELATKHVQEFVNACKPNDLNDVGNALLKLISVTGQAMLRTQAAEIESLETRIDEHTALCIKRVAEVTRERDALKADADRYQWWVTQVELKDFENLEKAFKSMEVREDVTKQMMDAAIDAMKGKS